MVCLIVGLDTIGLNLTYLIVLSIHDKDSASPGIFSLIVYIDVFLSLLGRITTEGFLSRILICLTIGHILLRVSLPSNTLMLWSNMLYIQQVFIFFKEVCDNLTFCIGSLMWSELRCVFVIHPKWMFYVEVLK
jgi:hypothetical protein